MTFQEYETATKLANSGIRIYLKEDDNVKSIYIDGKHFRDVHCSFSDAIYYAMRLIKPIIVPALSDLE